MSKAIEKPDHNQRALDYILAGATLSQTRAAMEKEGFQPAEIASALDCALQFFKAQAEFNPDLAKGEAIARLRMLISKSLHIHEYKTAIQAQKELNKLMNLYPASKEPTRRAPDPEETTESNASEDSVPLDVEILEILAANE